jgi:hypothetical protein
MPGALVYMRSRMALLGSTTLAASLSGRLAASGAA